MISELNADTEVSRHKTEGFGTSDLPSGVGGGKALRLEEIKAKALLTQKWRGLFMVAVRERGGR